MRRVDDTKIFIVKMVSFIPLATLVSNNKNFNGVCISFTLPINSMVNNNTIAFFKDNPCNLNKRLVQTLAY